MHMTPRVLAPLSHLSSALRVCVSGVNNGMAIKSAAVQWRQSQDPTDVESCYERMEKMDRYHGQASGIFSCDECLAGLNPSRGTELCTVVETMFSYSTIFSILGDPIFADKVEQITFNALPASITPDMWAHQYLQQSNQAYAKQQADPWWNTDGGDSVLFGLEPNYGSAHRPSQPLSLSRCRSSPALTSLALSLGPLQLLHG